MNKKLLLLTLISLIFCGNLIGNEYINKKLDEQDELISSIECEMMNMRILIKSLKSDNENINTHAKNMEDRVKICDEKIIALENNISSLKTALISNKEDTHEIIEVLGSMEEEIEGYKKLISDIKAKSERANQFANILIPMTTLPLVATGAYLYCFTNNKTCGKACMIGGVSLFIGCEIVWNGGHTIFKWW